MTMTMASTRHHEAQRQVILGKRRIGVLMAAFAVLFSTVAFRLVDITKQSLDAPAAIASTPAAVEGAYHRRDVVDRRGMTIATDVPVEGVFASPRDVPDDPETIWGLARILQLPADRLARDMAADRGYAWLSRTITPDQHRQIMELGVPGVDFKVTPQRLYPQGPLMSHLVGLTNIDNRGIAGIEQHFDARLHAGFDEPDPTPFALSIDLRVQQVLREELQKGIQTYQAKAGNGMVMDVRTGEVVAMVSLPDFDPNSKLRATGAARDNRNTESVYEVGSLFKTVTFAQMIDARNMSLDSTWDVTKSLVIGRHSIGDTHLLRRWATAADVFTNSSNVGTARMALSGGAELQREYLKRFGLLRKAELEVPGVASPLVPKRWPDVTVAVVSFGHSLAITPLQFMNAFCATVNGGFLHPATLVRQDGAPPPGNRVIGQKASDELRYLLWLNVVNGTGSKARVDGYLVGGKTGTADKKGAGKGYARNSVISSFVAAFPMEAPRYAVLIMLDDPTANAASGGFRYGAWNATPVAGNVIRRIGPLLQVPFSPPEAEDGFLARAPADVQEKELKRRQEASLAALDAR